MRQLSLLVLVGCANFSEPNVGVVDTNQEAVTREWSPVLVLPAGMYFRDREAMYSPCVECATPNAAVVAPLTETLPDSPRPLAPGYPVLWGTTDGPIAIMGLFRTLAEAQEWREGTSFDVMDFADPLPTDGPLLYVRADPTKEHVYAYPGEGLSGVWAGEDMPEPVCEVDDDFWTVDATVASSSLFHYRALPYRCDGVLAFVSLVDTLHRTAVYERDGAVEILQEDLPECGAHPFRRRRFDANGQLESNEELEFGPGCGVYNLRAQRAALVCGDPDSNACRTQALRDQFSDPTRSLRMHRWACELGVADSCRDAALHPRSTENASSRIYGFLRECENGDETSCATIEEIIDRTGAEARRSVEAQTALQDLSNIGEQHPSLRWFAWRASAMYNAAPSRAERRPSFLDPLDCALNPEGPACIRFMRWRIYFGTPSEASTIVESFGEACLHGSETSCAYIEAALAELAYESQAFEHAYEELQDLANRRLDSGLGRFHTQAARLLETF